MMLRSIYYPYGEKSGIQFLWDQNTKHGIKLQVVGAWKQKLVRVNGVFLMDQTCNKVRRVDLLQHINNVCLYLKVSRLSDIVTKDGIWIH